MKTFIFTILFLMFAKVAYANKTLIVEQCDLSAEDKNIQDCIDSSKDQIKSTDKIYINPKAPKKYNLNNTK